MDGTFNTSTLGELWDQVLELLSNPYSNPTASLLLLAAIVVFVLLVAMIVMSIVARPSRREEVEDEEELRLLLQILQSDEGEDDEFIEVPSRHETAPVVTVKPIRRGVWLSTIAIALVAITMAVGATTSSEYVCTSCHASNPHSDVVTAGGTDPHAGTSCIRCHEAGSLAGSVTLEVPARLAHMIAGIDGTMGDTSYGSTTTIACIRCHSDMSGGVVEDEERGVRMAHEQPLDAGADCRDCHTLATGVVSRVTVGMSPCLRCHDGETAPVECSYCHTQDVSAATSSRRNPAEQVGRSLVPEPTCGGCHDEPTQCDPCHGGVRMPHSQLFMGWGHARKGVEDIWYNNGEACSRCHYEDRRPCTDCHAFFPGHDNNAWKTQHGASGNTNSCESCHSHQRKMPGRDFCELCHGIVVEQ